MAHASHLSDIKGRIGVTSASMGAGSDFIGDVNIHEPCGPCRKSAERGTSTASWHCKECDDFICDNCKHLHRKFKSMENHTLTSLCPSCRTCEKRNNQVEANHFCTECNEFLCDECKSHHMVLTITENHSIISSLEKFKDDRQAVLQTDVAKDKDHRPHVRNVNTATEIIRTDDHGTSMTGKADGGEDDRVKVQVNPVPEHRTAKQSTAYVPLSKRSAQFVTKFDATVPGDLKSPNISGSAFLPDSRLLLVDTENKKLKIFDNNFKFVTQKQFADSPWDVAVYDSSDVAVVVGNHNIVRLAIAGEDFKEIGRMSTPFRCCSVDYISGEELALSGGDRFARILYVYSTDGQELSKVGVGYDRPGWSVKVDGKRSRAYVSTEGPNIVTAINLKNKKIMFTYRHRELSQPRGLAVDQESNFYVCGHRSQNIHQVSPEGKCIRILLSQEDSVVWPKTISFSSRENSFVINQGKSLVNVYKLI